MLYKGDKDINVAARQPESGPAETGGLSATNLPLVSIPRPARMPDGTEIKTEIRKSDCVFLQPNVQLWLLFLVWFGLFGFMAYQPLWFI